MGITLIELLVVVSILATLAAGAGLWAGGAFTRSDAAPGASVEAALRALRDRALLGRVVVGIYPRAEGWVAAEDSDGEWRLLPVPFQTRADFGWQIAGQAYLPRSGTQEAPPIQFAPDGGMTPFVVTLQGTAWRCAGRTSGGLACGAQ